MYYVKKYFLFVNLGLVPDCIVILYGKKQQLTVLFTFSIWQVPALPFLGYCFPKLKSPPVFNISAHGCSSVPLIFLFPLSFFVCGSSLPQTSSCVFIAGPPEAYSGAVMMWLMSLARHEVTPRVEPSLSSPGCNWVPGDFGWG